MIPLTINTAKAISKAGVNIDPTISTTFDGLIVKTNTRAKNTIENITGLIPEPIVGNIPIS